MVAVDAVPLPASSSTALVVAEHRIVFTPAGLQGSVPEGSSVLDAARAFGVDLDSVCGGRGICGRCQVEPSLGDFAKWAIQARRDNLSAPGALEAAYSGRRPLPEHRRLGCAAKVLGDVVIDIPASSQIHKQVIRKSVDVGDLALDPIFSLHYLGDEDLPAALSDGWGITVSPPTVPLPHGDKTVAVRGRAKVVAAWPGFVDRVGGIAVDVGSTTIAGHLVDVTTGEILATAGRMNPQIRFGEDLMSRVSYVMMNPGGDVELTAAVHAAINERAMELIDDAGLDAADVLDVTLVGNPIMHHLALGLDPTPLGQAPFTLALADAHLTTATALELDLPNASVYIAPCIAGHVGADTAAAILNEGPHRGDAVQLLVDVGTNAEIVLGNNERLYAASSPTGPAFEGAQISAGQRATTGAIERVRIDRDSLEPSVRVIGSLRWSTDEGFNDATSASGVTGICGSGIIEAVSELVMSGVIDNQGVIRGDAAARSPRVVADGRTFAYVLHDELRITQADVRAIQLAKAALRAGIQLLIEHAGFDRIDEIRLAGAFGAHIDPAHAMVLGLIPDAPLDTVRAVGNAAGSGAVRLLLSAQQRREVEAVVRTVTRIETATEPRFQELFVEALAFPHAVAPAATSNAGRRRRRAARSNSPAPRSTP